MGLCKSYSKKENKRKKELRKIDKCSRYLKQWILRCPPGKKR
jgi:hypothetical protein